jgi:hypothetical protein
MTLDIDPEMQYCLKCNGEYMPEISTCAVCGLTLISGDEMLERHQAGRQQLASRKGALTPDDDIVTIFKSQLADVKRVELQLQKENIGTLVWGDKASCGKGCCGGGELELRVRREDAMAALAVIEADFKRQTASHEMQSAIADCVVDLGESENCCPACGCTFAMAHQQDVQALTCPDCGLCFG